MKARFDIRIHRNRCKGCQLCMANCAKGVLRMSDEFNEKGLHFSETAHPEDCTGCRRCADICPDAAIEISSRGDDSDNDTREVVSPKED